MIKVMQKTFLLIGLILIFAGKTWAATPISIDMQNANLNEVIRSLATFLHLNIIINPSVQGMVTIHLLQADPIAAFDLLLSSNGLAKWPMGNIWYIAPRDELFKRRQDEVKWQELWQESTPLMTLVVPIQYANARDIARILQDERTSFLSKRGVVRVDLRTNALCIREIPHNISRIRQFIKQLDVPIKQITIMARLVSLDSDYARALGIRFSVDNTRKDETKLLDRVANGYSIAVVKLADASQLEVKLAALEDEGHAELISNPTLFTTNQQAASIEAGEEVPYQEVSDSGGTAIAFKKAVLGLRVTPQVLPRNKVLLKLQINQDRPSRHIVLGMPTISTRQITTNVLVNSGQTIVLGGIYETNQENIQERIPFISDIPLLGRLFVQNNVQKYKRELLIFVTPIVVE